MRVLVMGTGGVGGYYGAMLASAGNDVTFVARGAHLEAMRSRGLEMRSQGKTIHLQPTKTVQVPAELAEPPELILFTVKTYDTDSAIEAIRPVVGPNTAVLTLQNGVDSVDRLSAALGADRVLAGVTLVASGIVEPGVVQENGFSRKVVVGEPNGSTSARVEAVAQIFRGADVEVEVSTNPQQSAWDKFVLVSPHATISSACQTPIGVTRETPEAMALYKSMVGEVKAVGEAAGFTFPADIADQIVGRFMTAPHGQTSSMQRDYGGERRVELEALTGTVVRRGRELGVPTPGFEALYAVLKVRAGTFGGLS